MFKRVEETGILDITYQYRSTKFHKIRQLEQKKKIRKISSSYKLINANKKKKIRIAQQRTIEKVIRNFCPLLCRVKILTQRK